MANKGSQPYQKMPIARGFIDNDKIFYKRGINMNKPL